MFRLDFIQPVDCSKNKTAVIPVRPGVFGKPDRKPKREKRSGKRSCLWKITRRGGTCGSEKSSDPRYCFVPRLYDIGRSRCRSPCNFHAILQKSREVFRGEKPHYFWHVKNFDERCDGDTFASMHYRELEIGSVGALWTTREFETRVSFLTAHSLGISA